MHINCGLIGLHREFVEKKNVHFIPPLFIATNATHILCYCICFFPLQQLWILQQNEHIFHNCLLAIFVITCIFSVVVIVHLTNSNMLCDFLFFTICCRSVIPIVVQLSPRYRKLKHHIFPVSLQLQVHLYFQTWPAFFMLSLLLYFSFPFYASFFFKSATGDAFYKRNFFLFIIFNLGMFPFVVFPHSF